MSAAIISSPLPSNALRNARMHTRSKGFTLIELMIVIAVIAVLTALAYPAYQDQVRKSRRAQAKADLVEYAQGAERYFTANNSYSGYTFPAQSPRQGTGFYTLSPTPLTDAEATAFTLTATATGDQANDRCGNLTLSSTGVKGKTGSAPDSECW